MKEFDEEAHVLSGDGAHAEATLLPWPADLIPGNETAIAGNFVSGGPQKSETQAVQSSEHTGRQLEAPHGEGGEGVEDGVEQYKPPTGGEKEGTPAGQIFVHLGNQRSERRELKLLSRQRQPEVGLQESFDTVVQLVLHLAKHSRLDMHGHQSALAVVDRQARGALELAKQRTEAPCRANVSMEDQEGVDSWIGTISGKFKSHRLRPGSKEIAAQARL
jgi:hypothetical protein